MIPVRKGPPPRALVTYRAGDPSGAARYDGAGFEAVKPAVRDALHAEQRGLCCYCNSAIRPDAASMKIEHRVPQRGPSADRSRDLDWSNLFGACLGRIAPRAGSAVLHCDTSKADNALRFDPSDTQHVATVGYDAARLTSSRAEFQREFDEVLNLNHDELRERRRRALDEVRRELVQRFPDKDFPEEKLRRVRQQICAPASGTLRPFVGYIAWGIDRWIRKRAAS